MRSRVRIAPAVVAPAVAALVVVAPLVGACSNSATSDGSTRDDAGEVVEGGEVGAFALRLGDCIAEDPDEGVFDSVPVVPCDEPHLLEIYHVFDLAGGDDWPGDAAVEERAAEGCLAAFRGFVGVPFESSVYDVTTLRPSEGSWTEIGDREVLCALFEPDGSLRSASARATAR